MIEIDKNHYELRTLKISGEKNKKIRLLISPLDKKLIIQGLYKCKILGNIYKVVSEVEQSMENDGNFDDAIKNTYKLMENAIMFLELTSAYLTDVDEVTITKD